MSEGMEYTRDKIKRMNGAKVEADARYGRASLKACFCTDLTVLRADGQAIAVTIGMRRFRAGSEAGSGSESSLTRAIATAAKMMAAKPNTSAPVKPNAVREGIMCLKVYE